MNTLITAGYTTALDASAIPSEIVYIPEGVHEITPTVNGKPGKVTVNLPANRGHEIAAAFQRDLERRNRDNVRPTVNFDHKAGAASALPVKFSYQAGRGLILALDWTNSGRAAIEGRDYSYFSPEFLLGDDGTPSGLALKGSVGALVNEPAFRNIPRIAAADAGDVFSTEFENRGSALVAAGDAANLDEAYMVLAAESPALYEDYCRSLHDGRRCQTVVRASYSEPDLVAQERAQALVAAGEASSLEEGLMKAYAADADLYEAYTAKLFGR